jgi:hypothetical protein
VLKHREITEHIVDDDSDFEIDVQDSGSDSNSEPDIEDMSDFDEN